MKRTVCLVVPSLLTVLVIAAASILIAQEPFNPNLVYVRVTASENTGRVVSGLRKEGFKILEDNVPQDIEYFSDNGSPLNVALLIDGDARMKDRVKEMAFTGLSKGRSSTEELYLMEPGDSPLDNAIYEALNKLLQRRTDKRALILFTTNTPGSRSFAKVRDLLKDQDIRFYVIAVPIRNDAAAEMAGPLLRELAEISGGTAFFPTSMIQVPDIYGLIGRELRYQYLLGYRSTNGANDGKWRKIKVQAQYVDPKGKTLKLNAKTRSGYYAPTVAGR